MGFYRIASLLLCAIFAFVGLVFLFASDPVLGLFNMISVPLAFPEAPFVGMNFYLILAVAYMYLVAVLAFMMYRHPEQPLYAILLIHGKTASSLLSLAFFITQGGYLVFLANFLVDGAIALFVYLMLRHNKKDKTQ